MATCTSTPLPTNVLLLLYHSFTFTSIYLSLLPVHLSILLSYLYISSSNCPTFTSIYLSLLPLHLSILLSYLYISSSNCFTFTSIYLTVLPVGGGVGLDVGLSEMTVLSGGQSNIPRVMMGRFIEMFK